MKECYEKTVWFVIIAALLGRVPQAMYYVLAVQPIDPDTMFLGLFGKYFFPAIGYIPLLILQLLVIGSICYLFFREVKTRKGTVISTVVISYGLLTIATFFAWVYFWEH